MSRRVPESLGSRLVARTVSGLPDPSVLDSIPQDAPPTSREVLAAFLSSRDAGKWPIDIFIAARWRKCRQVYDFDRRLSEALARTPAGDVPAEAIRLPYPIQYVSADIGGFSGFFATSDALDGGRIALGITLLRGDLEHTHVIVPLDGTVDEAVSYWRSTYGTDLARLAGMPQVDVDELRGCVAHAVALVMYICSADADSEVTYRPPSGGRGQRVGKRTNPETIHEVGGVIGRALGAPRHVGGSTGDGTHASPAPHMRAAHWQHFWVGPRKGRTDGRPGDKLVLRWVPPVPVMGGGGGEVVHPVSSP